MPSAIPEKKEDDSNADFSAFGLKHYDNTTSYIATEEEYK